MMNNNNLNIDPINVRHEIDIKIPLTFALGMDCESEELYADVYIIGDSFLANVNTGPVVTGGVKGTLKTILLDFSEIPVGDNYSIIIRTAETGIINKGPLVILAADGYSEEDISSISTMNGGITRFDTDYTITKQGIYCFFGDTARTVTISPEIKGAVEIRTIATKPLVLSGSIHSEHIGVLYPGNAMLNLRWEPISGTYIY